MFITPSFKKSLIVEQFQGNYLKNNATIALALYLPQQRHLMNNVPNCAPFLLVLITSPSLRDSVISNFDSRNPSILA